VIRPYSIAFGSRVTLDSVAIWHRGEPSLASITDSIGIRGCGSRLNDLAEAGREGLDFWPQRGILAPHFLT
jgi:hypothetical protein